MSDRSKELADELREDGVFIEHADEIDRLRAEVAALKANHSETPKGCDPLAEMWRELSEYQPFADRDGHGESWRRMCRERTEDAARAAMEDDAARSAAGYAAAAASGAAGASMWARLSIALIRRAKEPPAPVGRMVEAPNFVVEEE
jgi:hypothetical protein